MLHRDAGQTWRHMLHEMLTDETHMHDMLRVCCESTLFDVQARSAGNARQFVTEEADSDALLSLSPPFRLFQDRDRASCDDAVAPDGIRKALGLAYYVTHTATACAQACIEYDSKLNRDGTPRAQCNAAAYYDDLGSNLPADWLQSDGSYSKWNCWLKTLHNICPTSESEPWPQGSEVDPDRDLLVRQSDEDCALELLH